MPLYPNTCDVSEKKIVIKIDLRPDRLNPKLLVECHIHGFVLDPSIPNSTAFTQEGYRNYAPFKSVFEELTFDLQQEGET